MKSIYYNEEIKQMALSEMKNPNGFSKMFINIRKYEEEFQKDFFDFSTEEYNYCFTHCLVANYLTNYRFVMCLKRYVKWANEKGLTTNESIFDIEIEDLDLSDIYIRHTIKNPADLIDRLNLSLERNINEETVSNRTRLVLSLLYLGIDEDSIFDINKSDVDLERNEINFNGKIYSIPAPMLPMFRMCVRQIRFAAHNSYVTYWDVTKLVGKTKPNQTLAYALIKNHRNDVNVNTEKTVRKNNCIRCGEWFRIYIEEKSGIENAFFNHITLDHPRVNGYKFRLDGEYIDYCNWKKYYEL